jgi:uncharacterized repeat protein (TIGR01451 family)
MAKGSGLTAWFFDDGVEFRANSAPVRVRFEGASPGVRIQGAAALSGEVNFVSGTPDQWRTRIPIYGDLVYSGLYPGIDMSYGVTGRNLKSEFTVAPGADPSRIRFRYLGAGPARVEPDGALLISSLAGDLRELSPVAWQMQGGNRVPVDARFTLDSDGAVRFALGPYDPSLPLIVDPVLSYSTFLGGSSSDAANAIAVDSSGAAYVAGFTASFDLPAVNPEQSANAGGNDAFVAKLSASGSSLVYCTYLGGRGDDRAFGIAVDSSGAAYVTGYTQSSNFPLRNALQATLAGSQNAFIAKLTPTGNNLAYSTFLGGNASDAGNAIAVDSSGNAYVAGDTNSTNFPTTNSYQKTYHGGQDAFIVKLNTAGASLTYSTYLGGGNTDHAAAIAIDSTGTAYVTGSTTSTDFPVLNAFQSTTGGGQDAFVTRLNATGSALLFSTYLGGSAGSTGYVESGQGIAVDSSGNAYITGVTPSANFPLLNPVQSSLNGANDAFVTKLTPTGALSFSTYLGGSGMDCANAIAIDSSANIYLAGYTYSTDFPVAASVQANLGGVGTSDAFVAKLTPGGSSIAFATYLGGNDSDTATGVAIDASGNMYVAGWTLSSNFPTLNAYQSQNAGNYGAFVTKYAFTIAPANVSVSPGSGGGPSGSFTFTYSDGNGATDITIAGALFGASSTSLVSSCAVIYNRAQNTLALLTDAGAQPATTIAPGSGTAQNSQCILNGGASSVSLSGNILTLTLALTFQPAFGGSKTIYMETGNSVQTTPWQTEGSWTIPATVSMSVSPSSGNATQQTFAFQFTDSFGTSDLTTVSALFNTVSTSVAAACMVTYNRQQNSLTLATDAGAQPASSLTPGSGAQQNSQCTLNGAGSSISAIGNVLTVNLALTFQPIFAGAKNVYGSAVSATSTVPWGQLGTWSSPPAISMSASPSSGSGSTQAFVFQVTDSTGASDLTTIGALFNSTATTTSACAVIYNRAQNTLALLTDAGAQPSTTITPGSGTAQNSQCTLNGATSTVTSSGNALTMSLSINFQAAFVGAKNVYMQAINPFETVNWTLEGTWNITTPPASLSIVKSHSGSFTQGQTGATYTLTVTNNGGAATGGMVTVNDALPTGLTATAMSGANWTCTQPAGPCTRSDALAPGASYQAITLTVNVAANVASSVTNSATASGGGVASSATANDVTAINPFAGSSVSIFSAGATPGTPFLGGSLTLGVKFKSDSAGNITGIRFYKGAANTGAHIGLLYAYPSGTLLAQATFSNETVSGWQQVNFASPVAITANTVYVAAYFSPSGFAYDAGAFTNAGVDNAPLHALQQGGVYSYGTAAQYPGNSGGGANYWADVAFSASGGAGAPSLSIASSHTGNFTQGQAGATYTLTVTNSGTAATSGTVTVADTLPTGLTATAMSGFNWTCTQPAGPCTRSDVLAAGASYETITVTVSVAANAAASLTNSATASGGGAASSATANDVTAINASGSGSGPSVSIFSASATPATAFLAGSLTVGVKFKSDSAGNITGIRFYKGAGNTGTHIGLLYGYPSGALLAQATFTNETASGWQQGNFASPVPITANTVYVAAYFSTSGFAYDAGVFTNAGVDNAPLHALQSSLSGGNSVYSYGTGATYPASSGGGANYWADVAFSTTAGSIAGPPSLSIASTHTGSFTQGQSGATYTLTVSNNGAAATSGMVTVTDALPSGLTATAMSGANWTCTQPAGPCTRTDALAVGASYETITVTVNVAANAPSSLTNSVTASGGGATSSVIAGDVSAINAGGSGSAASIFSASAVPGTPFLRGSLTVGVRFKSGLAGNITGIRFYKGVANTGTHIGLLYAYPSGTLLAQATFTNETASGWQQVNFSSPVPITANTVYVAAYFSPTGFAYDAGVFTNAGVDNAPLHALQTGVSGGNGVYAYSAEAQYPANSGNGANYWVDVAFSATGAGSSIFSASAVPTVPFLAGSLTVGVKFKADSAGSITGIRFYKGTANTGMHIGLLYAYPSGNLLAQATFTNETASGWQEVSFPNPVAITANTVYVAAYFSSSGFAYDAGALTNAGVDNAPLHALHGVSGGNGVYAYGAGPQYPVNSGGGANYWADVVFSVSSAPQAP